jgi:Peptidase A4 family
MRRFGRLAVITGAAAAVVGVSPGLAAASPAAPGMPGIPGITLVSPIASGYAAVPRPGGPPNFIHVQAIWAVPAVACTAKNATAQTRAGLDGITDSTAEQVGVNEVCLNAVPFYTAFYRMYPAALVPTFHPSPGDQVMASVTADGGVFTLSVKDLTSGQSFTVTKTCPSCLGSSAEVTAGSPSGVAPADFGVVHFTDIVVTDGANVSGGLANPAWNTDKLTQPGSPHTVAGPLHTLSPPPHSAFADTWAP